MYRTPLRVFLIVMILFLHVGSLAVGCSRVVSVLDVRRWHRVLNARQVKVEPFAQRKQQRTPKAGADLDVVIPSGLPTNGSCLFVARVSDASLSGTA